MRQSLFGPLIAAAGSLAIALVCFFLFHSNATIAAIFLLLGVLLAGAYATRADAIAASVTATLCLDYLFIPPIWKITIADPQGWLVLAVFLTVSIIATNLSTRMRSQRDELAARQSDSEKLHALNRAILLCDGGPRELHRLVLNKCLELFAFEEAALFETGSGEVYSSNKHGAISDAELHNVARNGSIAISGRATTLPITLGNKIYGSFAFSGDCLSASLLQSLGNTIAVGLAQAQTQQTSSRAEAVRKSEELKSVMIDALAHELKTPLTAIEASASMLSDDRLSAEQRAELVAIVQEEAQRLRRLMGEAIHLARIEAKRFKLDCQVMPVEAVVREAIEALQQRVATHPFQLQLNDAHSNVFADRELAVQLIKQLLDNATKYSPAGKPITVCATEDGPWVSISVRDEGQGLTELEQSHVFDKFYRARRDHSGVQGTGMGLAIAREIADAHGGAIHVESQLGQGSRFTVTLPASER